MRGLTNGNVRCLLIQPRFSRNNLLNYRDAAKFIGAKYTSPPLGLLTVAALLPEQWNLKLIDENVDDLHDDHLEWADLVLTGGMLPQQLEILRIVERAHEKDKPVVLGGIDPTTQTEIYQHADFLVLGEGEIAVPLFVDDLRRGVTTGVYKADRWADMSNTVVPRFDLINFRDYVRCDVQFSRGCPYHCEFCAVVELFGRKPRSKTPDHVLAELQRLYNLGYRGHINLLDDNFLGSKARGIEFLRTLKDWSAQRNFPFFFSTDASINLAHEDELLRLMHENDFRHLFVGIESADESVLIKTHKRHNTGISMRDAVRTFNAHGMSVIGGFIVGFDNESDTSAQHMIDLIQDTGIVIATAGMLVALPNTQLWHRLREEGRLHHGELLLLADMGEEGDHTTNGLNFSTARPRTQIIREYAGILRHIYGRPENYYHRVLKTAHKLAPNYKYRPNLRARTRQIGTFIRVTAKAGFNQETGALYWKGLLNILTRKPAALEFYVMMSALYVHFYKQVDVTTGILEDKIRTIESAGEDRYNETMSTRHLTAVEAVPAERLTP